MIICFYLNSHSDSQRQSQSLPTDKFKYQTMALNETNRKYLFYSEKSNTYSSTFRLTHPFTVFSSLNPSITTDTVVVVYISNLKEEKFILCCYVIHYIVSSSAVYSFYLRFLQFSLCIYHQVEQMEYYLGNVKRTRTQMENVHFIPYTIKALSYLRRQMKWE